MEAFGLGCCMKQSRDRKCGRRVDHKIVILKQLIGTLIGQYQSTPNTHVLSADPVSPDKFFSYRVHFAKPDRLSAEEVPDRVTRLHDIAIQERKFSHPSANHHVGYVRADSPQSDNRNSLLGKLRGDGTRTDECWRGTCARAAQPSHFDITFRAFPTSSTRAPCWPARS